MCSVLDTQSIFDDVVTNYGAKVLDEELGKRQQPYITQAFLDQMGMKAAETNMAADDTKTPEKAVPEPVPCGTDLQSTVAKINYYAPPSESRDASKMKKRKKK